MRKKTKTFKNEIAKKKLLKKELFGWILRTRRSRHFVIVEMIGAKFAIGRRTRGIRIQ